MLWIVLVANDFAEEYLRFDELCCVCVCVCVCVCGFSRHHRQGHLGL